MRPSSTKSKISAIILGVLLILSLNFFQKEVKGFFYLISSPIQKSLWKTGDSISDFFETIIEIKNLKKETQALKLKNQNLLAEIASLKELKKENETLRETLEIGLKEDFKLVFVEIVGKDIADDSLLIDRGSEDGVSEEMPVITSQKVLLGKISEVYENFSKVLLISNENSAFDAKISDSEILGIVKGGGSFRVFFELIPRYQEIKEGDLVVTSALSKIYPPGLLIGLIKEIKKSDVKPFQQAEIAPFFDIKEIERIFIITKY